MSARAAALGVLAAALVAVAIVVLSSGSEPYRLRMTIPNTHGLRKGSDVRIAGATVGHVSSIKLGRGDAVDVELKLDPHEARLGRNASVAVKSNNLLGEKYVQIERGNVSSPAPSGTVIPRSRISFPVDLDQVLDVLDADTRARLAILVNQAGIALTGRHIDLNRMLAVAPRSVDRATRLVEQATADNRALVDLIANTDRFIGRMARDRRPLGRLVDTAGEAMRTLAARRAHLRETLRDAPATLTTARRFLADLRSTTVPLGPAARTLAAAAPPLTTTLSRIAPFTEAATPTLRRARVTAPILSRLARRATPVIREAVPPVESLRGVARTAPPLSKALADGIDGVLAALEGWARAIQGRDSIGHVFRGHLNVSTELIKSLISRVTTAAPGARHRIRRHSGPTQLVPRRATKLVAPHVGRPRVPLPAVPLPAIHAPASDNREMKKLLDFLLKP